MSDAKEIFLRDKELSGKWGGWTHGPDAAKVFAFADAELLAHPGLNAEQIRGAQIFKAILLTLADPDEGPSEIPKSGLNHDIDPKPRTIAPNRKKV